MIKYSVGTGFPETTEIAKQESLAYKQILKDCECRNCYNKVTTIYWYATSEKDVITTIEVCCEEFRSLLEYKLAKAKNRQVSQSSLS